MPLDRRFLDSTRGQIVRLLQRDSRTVEELARELGLTDNAVRNHLATLERDGLVRAEGVRRGPGAGKPAFVYELVPEAATRFSRAYAPTLTTLIDVLLERMSPEEAEPLLREVGHRLAHGAGGTAAGDFDARVRAAARVLTELGGDIEITATNGTRRIQGSACPLAAVVSRHPEVCAAVETLVGDVAGASATSCCEHGDRPRCRFDLDQTRKA